MITSALLFVLLLIHKLTFLSIKWYSFWIEKLILIAENSNSKIRESIEIEGKLVFKYRLLNLILKFLYKIHIVYRFFNTIALFIQKAFRIKTFKDNSLILLIVFLIGLIADTCLFFLKLNLSLNNFISSIVLGTAFLYALFYKKGYKRLIFVLLIQPMAFTFILLVLIANFIKYFIPNYNISIVNYALFGTILFFPTIVSIYLYFYYMKCNKVNFEIDLPVAVEFNSTVAVIFVGASWFYLWSIGDIKSLLTPEITQFLVTGQTSLKDGLINYSRVVSLPFLFSNGVLKFLIQRQKFLSTVRRKT